MKYLVGRDFAFPDYVERFPRDLGYAPLDMRADLELDWGEVRGTVRYRVRAARDIGVVQLDAVDMEVLWASHDYHYDGKRISLAVRLPRGGEDTVVVKYRARPRKGMYFVDGMVWTQGEAEDNRHWIPLPDSPHVKFPWTVSVSVRRPHAAYSNGRLAGVSEAGDRTVWTWEMGHPMSPYLLAIVAGEFEVIREECGGVSLEYYLPKGTGDLHRYSFHNTCRILEFFSSYLGVPYPYSRYAQAVVREFIYGGMENTTITVLTDWTLHDEHAHCPYTPFPCPDLEDYSSDPLVAHEAAHQWFGDLVTAKDWAHIPINESFATFLEALWTEHSKGRDEYIYEMYSNFRVYLGEYANRYSRPLVTHLYKLPEEVFDRHAYEKGSVILHMLRSMLGDEAFRAGLRSFLERHRYRPADMEDLRKALEEATGTDLEKFWRQYIYSAGHPVLKVSWNYDVEKGHLVLRVRQAQQDDSFPVYDLALEVDVVYGGGRRERRTMEVADRENTYVFPGEKPLYVCVDPEFKVMKALEVELPLDAAGHMLGDPHVYCRLQAVEALRKDRGARAVELLARAVEDGFWGVAAEAARALGEAGTEDSVRALKALYGRVRHPRVRRAIVEGLGKAGRRTAADLLDSVLHDTSESYYVRAEAARALGKVRWDGAEASLVKALEYPSHVDVVRRGALEGLANLRTENALRIVLEHARDGKPTPVRATAVQALARFGPRHEVLEAIRESMRDDNFRVRYSAVIAAMELMDPRLLDDLQRAADADLDGRVRRAAREAAEKIRRAMERGAEYQRLREEVERLKEEHRRLLERVAALERKY